MFSDEKTVDSIVQNGYTVKIGNYLEQGLALFKQNIGGFIGYIAILLVFGLVIGLLPDSLSNLGSLIQLVVGGPLTAGFYIVAFKLLKGQKSEFADFFLGFNNFLPFFLVSLVSTLLTALGIILIVLPGIYLAVAYSFAVPLVVARKFDFWEAMEGSRKIITKNWFSFFGLLIVLVLINVVGALLLGLGLLVTLPVTVCTIAVAFKDIVGLPASDSTI